MSEPISSSASPSTSVAGNMLRAARLAQNLDIDALASMIKVTPAKLDALENGRHDQLPDANFTRALAMTVCRSLKIDPAPVLAALPAAKAIPLSPNKPALNQPFKESRGANLSFDSGESFDFKSLLKLQWLAPILLLLASLAVYLLPESIQWPHWATRSATKPVAEAPSAPAPAPGASTAIESANAPEIVSSQSEVSGAASMPAAEPAPSQAAATAGSEVKSTSGPLVLTSRAPAWVEVRDQRGLLLSRHLKGGEKVELEGAPPFKLRLGNSAAVEVIYQGLPVELASFTRNNVARFELK